MADQPTVRIPEQGGTLGMTPEVKNRFEKIDNILIAVVASVLVSLVAVVVSVIGLFLDQMRYNNVAYKEYSEKIRTLNFVNENNQNLLEQNNQNQKLIIEQQKQLSELLRTK